ncbi:voltage-gated chloride channel [Suhomyces tanzawaensis NRRL Y-17324]|uniref:Chloride channel protein n=1 Tax=Suhomyces tanzawaensis NRRL Y-17324 TaxID=984487 RepID=A0A1E4SJ43_9ASCO|nr:voltage-gated chloride channel [Suhomyces tanzawaensis NRRL Y-17324]ODV79521.1 voltage-gated chloride channel [Suhomyces tanzawaensis NRRL Y-17324]
MDIPLHETTAAPIRSRRTGLWTNQSRVREVKRFEDFRTIDWVEDELDEHRKRILKLKHSTGSSLFLQKLWSSTQSWLVLAVIGVAIGLIAAILNIVTAWLASIRTGHCTSGFYLSRTFCCWNQGEESCLAWVEWSHYGAINYVAYVAISLVFASTAAVLVQRYAPLAAGSGISEIKCIVSGFVVEGFLGAWTLFIKSLGLPLAIASGLSVGKEGPSVHYAVCVGNTVAGLVPQYRKSAARAREVLTATAAAGVAVAFGSPMGGVLFSIEEISSVFQLATIWKSYFCSLVAVITLAAMNPFRSGQLVLFEVQYDTDWHFFEIPVYVAIGVFGGVYGIVVSKLNIQVVSFRKRFLANHAVREVVVLSLLTASFCYFNQFLRVDMTEAMQVLFQECSPDDDHGLCDASLPRVAVLASLVFATIARMALTIITYGCKVPAGIFVPSMAAGATFGRALGIVVDQLYRHYPNSRVFGACAGESKCVIPGTYAFLGAAAALSGITHLSVTVVIIMFELTGALRYIIPTMVVVAITKSINDRWGKGGIADQMIKFNGLPLIDAREEFTFNATVEAAMTAMIVTFPEDSNDDFTLGHLKTTLKKTAYRGFPIIKSSSNPKITGFVSRSDLEYILRDYEGVGDDTPCSFSTNNIISSVAIDFKSIINQSPLTINIDVPLEYVLEIFVKLGPRYILVEKEGILVGLITRKDVLRYEHTSHYLHTDHGDDLRSELLEAKVWEIMNHFSKSIRKNLGRLIFNDEYRFYTALPSEHDR